MWGPHWELSGEEEHRQKTGDGWMDRRTDGWQTTDRRMKEGQIDCVYGGGAGLELTNLKLEQKSYAAEKCR